MTKLPEEKHGKLVRIVRSEAKIRTWAYQNIKQEY
jgi:hypothetical protein